MSENATPEETSETLDVDLNRIARELSLQADGVERTMALLDEGNTVPFITRYRKDQTGGLDEEQVRAVQDAVSRARQLADRKTKILKSIESQGKLNDKLAKDIRSARTTKRLEDLYLPFKPKKQTLATVARQRGLEPFASEIDRADPAVTDMYHRASQFIDAENGLESTKEVLAGVGHILAEQYSERADVRDTLRGILCKTGKLVTSRIEPPAKPEPPAKSEAPAKPESAPKPESSEQQTTDETSEASAEPAPEQTSEATSETDSPAETTVPADTSESSDAPQSDLVTSTEAAITAPAENASSAANGTSDAAEETAATETSAESDQPADETAESAEAPAVMPQAERSIQPPADAASEEQSEEAKESAGDAPASEQTDAAAEPTAETPSPAAKEDAAAKKSPKKKKPARKKDDAQSRQSKKEKKRQKLEAAFKDYFQFEEELSKIPPHRVLAINRAERAKILRVKVESDVTAMMNKAEELLVPVDHPCGEFLRSCVRDAMTRLVIPSLEREIRREATDKAEGHAVSVFIQNLRNLLLQPPIHGQRVLAVDPGFKSGCKLAALDEFGKTLGHGVIHVIGNAERRKQSRSRLVEMVKLYHVNVIAIGNGSACRETEEFVGSVLSSELKDLDVSYVIVNEAGASVYSTSPVGREELPDYDAVLRSAVSIGRRLLDPLSELVKINPANIGVGLYQHDVKAKHLRDSLDAVVESCVNYVGVDVNSASPQLLTYVSGLNQLTARNVYDYRQANGPFKNREQLKQVPGFGDSAFVQSAGFLQIKGGDNPLDTTWIHPESYATAEKVLEKLGGGVDDLISPPPAVTTETVEATGAIETGATEIDDAKAAAQSADQTVAQQAPQEESIAQDAEPSKEATAAEGESASEEVVAATEAPAEAPEASAADADSSTADAAEPVTAAESDQQEATESAAEDDTQNQDESASDEQSNSAEATAPEVPAVQSPDAEAQATEAPASEAPVAEAATPTVEAPAPKSQLAEKIQGLDVSSTAKELEIGELSLRDILASLAKPGRDPREDLPPPIFRRGIMKMEDLEPGMELSGTVLNVVDFGAFVDIGLSDTGLVHISRLADRFVKDPHEIVSVGDVLKVWVMTVDKQRRRVSLTAIEPGTEKPQSSGGKKRGGAGKPRGEGGKGRGGKPRGDRKGGKRPGGRRDGGGRSNTPRVYEVNAKAPAKEITQEMKEGAEPMRSFSDLLQFYDKDADSKKNDNSDKKDS